MHVFVTGGSGFIGSAAVQDLIAAGHTVLGLARSDSSAAKLTDMGAQVLRGDLTDLESLKQGARTCDGVVHLGFIVDFKDLAGSCARDVEAITAMGEAMAGTNKPLIHTTGSLVMTHDKLAVESDEPDMSNPFGSIRGGSEQVLKKMVPKSVRPCIIRLPPVNYGAGDGGFITMLMKAAKEHGEAGYVGDGANVWTAAHRLDSARVYRLALEKGRAGAAYHPVGEQGVSMKDLMTAIGKKLDIPVTSITPEEANKRYGFLGMVVGINAPVSGEATKKELGWQATQPGLLETIANEY